MESCKLFIPSNNIALFKKNHFIDKKFKIIFTNATYYVPTLNVTENICYAILDPIIQSSNIIHDIITTKKYKRWTSGFMNNGPKLISPAKFISSDLKGIEYCTNKQQHFCLQVLEDEQIICEYNKIFFLFYNIF